MNDLTTPSEPPFPISSRTAELLAELAKMLALVAPITMTAEQQEIWLRAAVDSLEGIWPREVAAVSQEVRGCVTRQAQIVPKIRELVSANRAHESRIRQIALPPPEHRETYYRDMLAHRGKPMSIEDTAELNRQLAMLGATKRYRPDGSKFDAPVEVADARR